MNGLRDIKIDELPFVGPAYAKRLGKLEIQTIWDLLHHVPTRFLDFSLSSPIKNLQIGEIATVKGRVRSFVNQYTRAGKPMQILTVEDETGKIEAVWFNQIYLSRTFKEGLEVSLAGTLDWFGRRKAMIAPEYEIIRRNTAQIHTQGLIPIYSETAGISSKWLRRKIHDALDRYKDDIVDFLPKNILTKYKIIDFKTALTNVHFPKSLEEFEKAKHRLAFDELLFLQIQNLQNKKNWQRNKVTGRLKIGESKIQKFIKSLPFELTDSQKKAVGEILTDMQKEIPMNRLLEGDVGSGKTVVGAIASYLAFLNGKKTIFMAPTQILAQQHFETLKSLFKGFKINIGLITGTSIKQSGKKTDIWVGTHALMNKKLKIKDVSLVIIDEQHKFGVEQRNALIAKSGTPHVLIMTATPIPRTVALTFFGDLDLSTLKELPKDRQKIVTWIVPGEKREKGFAWISRKIKQEKVQAFVVCPLIEESEREMMSEVKAATHEFHELETNFPDLKFGLLHSRIKTKEKENIMKKFRKGLVDVLVTTPVVEVGIDIANATIMVIEAADRFGLASLHQLRGRVGRGEKKSFCLLMTESEAEKTQTRLKALTQNLSGFELAELDLKMRGPGEIFGKKQSGFPELKIADWSDIALIKLAKKAANEVKLEHDTVT